MHVTTRYQPHVVTQAMVDAAVQAGHPLNRDHNGADILGVGFNHLTIRTASASAPPWPSCVRRWSGPTCR